jgi:hypothetical protein
MYVYMWMNIGQEHHDMSSEDTLWFIYICVHVVIYIFMYMDVSHVICIDSVYMYMCGGGLVIHESTLIYTYVYMRAEQLLATYF